MPNNWEIVYKTEDDFDNIEDDGYYYHITTPELADVILEEGLDPSLAAIPRGRRNDRIKNSFIGYSDNKVFVTDAGNVGFWLSQNRARSSGWTILRIPKNIVGELPIDIMGTRDAKRYGREDGGYAYYSTEILENPKHFTNIILISILSLILLKLFTK